MIGTMCWVPGQLGNVAQSFTAWMTMHAVWKGKDEYCCSCYVVDVPHRVRRRLHLLGTRAGRRGDILSGVICGLMVG